MRLITRTEIVATENEWGVPVVRTVTHLGWFEARRQARIIREMHAARESREALEAASSEW